MGTLGPINIEALKAKHRRGKTMIRAAAMAAAEEASEDAVRHQRLYPKFRPRTGHLQATTKGRVVRLRGGAKVVLSNTAKYAASIDRGAGPHLIRARRAKSLRFVIRGKVIFRRVVNHPGNQAYWFLYKATRHGYRMFLKRLEARLAGVARKF